MVAKIRKAIAAAVAAGLAALVQALPDGITAQEVGIIIGAMLVAGYAIFRVPNAKDPEPQPNTMKRYPEMPPSNV